MSKTRKICHPNDDCMGFVILFFFTLNTSSITSSGSSVFVFHPKSISLSSRLASSLATFEKFVPFPS